MRKAAVVQLTEDQRTELTGRLEREALTVYCSGFLGIVA